MDFEYNVLSTCLIGGRHVDNLKVINVMGNWYAEAAGDCRGDFGESVELRHAGLQSDDKYSENRQLSDANCADVHRITAS